MFLSSGVYSSTLREEGRVRTARITCRVSRHTSKVSFIPSHPVTIHLLSNRSHIHHASLISFPPHLPDFHVAMAAPEDVRNGRKAKLSSNDSGLFEAARRLWQKSYAGDYLGLALLLAAYLFIKFWGEPFHQMFRLSDARIQHPHAEVERVSVGTSVYLLMCPRASPRDCGWG